MVIKNFIGILMLLIATSSFAHGLKSEKILRLKYNNHKDIEKLVLADFDIAGIDLKEGTVDVVMYGEENIQSHKDILNSFQILKSIDTTKMVPDSEYKNPEEMAEIIAGFANNFPSITELHTIGTSVEGRPIYALKITDNPAMRELDEPTILFNSMHHAREIMTPEVAIDIMEYLTTNYGLNADVTNWVDNTEIWVVPMVNPDGNHRVWTSDNMWRKNARDGHGVDNNRNYPYMWGACQGSSGSRYSQTYRGPSAGSEPETQAIMQLVANIEPVFDISFHSYSELVLYPYGCSGERTVNRAVVEGLGREMGNILDGDFGGSYEPGTPWEILYSVDGGDIDWMYNEYGVIPYVVELNSSRLGFQPDYSYRDSTVENARKSWQLLLNRLQQSGVRGVIRDQNGRSIPAGELNVSSLGDSTLSDYTMRIKNDGTYHLVLSPGMYEISFNVEGKNITQNITVGNGLTIQDITL